MVEQGPGKPKKPWFKKWWVWAIAILLLIGFSRCGGGDNSATTTTGGATTATAEKTESPPAATQPADPAALLEKQIRDELGKSNRDVERVTDYLDDGNTLTLTYAINDNVSTNLIRVGARNDIVDILKAVQASGKQFEEVRLAGTFSMVDQLGNAQEKQVVLVTYTGETISKINFDNFLSENVYKIADTSRVHSEFQ